jgi:signal transduction histidine kinase
MGTTKTHMIETIKTLLDVPTTDPDERRRSRLLNIFLVGFFVLSVFGIGAALVALSVIRQNQEGILLGLYAGISIAIFTSITFVINRYGSGKLARFFFILFLTVAFAFSDVPEEVASGRSLVAFAIPIILTSVLFPAYASFFAAGLVSVLITGVALYADIVPDPFAVITFFMIALAAWLAGRSMERAIRDLRILNEELDQRVRDRTRELAASLRREHTQAVRNKTILQSIADGVLVFDANQDVILANPAASRLAERELQALPLADFLSTIEGQARTIIQDWLAGQKPADLNHVRFEWHERTISANVAPVILSDDGEEKRVGDGNVMVLRDFTREAQLEKAKNLFLGMVSHELRTPMSAIQGYVDVLLASEKGNLSEPGYEYLQTIRGSIKQLVQLANELIDLSRMETGEIDLYLQWVDLETVVQNAARIVRQEYEARKLSLDIQIEADLPELFVDQNRLNQVLLNLLSNAYKYTSRGGVTVVVIQTDEWINIEVRDTGLGIKESDQAKMFERFFRASDRLVQQASGVGLGLNISKSLIELHGGKLTFESQYGVGTTFTVALPKNNPLLNKEDGHEINGKEAVAIQV